MTHPYIGLWVAFEPARQSGAAGGSFQSGTSGRIAHVDRDGIVILTQEGRHVSVPFGGLVFDEAVMARLEARWPKDPEPQPPPAPATLPAAPSARPPGHPGYWTRDQWTALVAAAPTLAALCASVDLDPKTVNKQLRRHFIQPPWARNRRKA